LEEEKKDCSNMCSTTPKLIGDRRNHLVNAELERLEKIINLKNSEGKVTEEKKLMCNL